MEGTTTLKSYLEQNHSFLKNVLSFSSEDLLERIKGFESYSLDSEDKKIIEKEENKNVDHKTNEIDPDDNSDIHDK